jgi:biotin carboxyl carrier protein
VKISAKVGDTLHDVAVAKENGHYVVEVDGHRHVIDCHKLEGDFYSILSGGKSYDVSVETTRDGYRVRHGAAVNTVTLTDPGRQAREGFAAADGPERIVAVMPGKVVRILVKEGDEVEAGQGVIVVEAMKMENEITVAKGGKVVSVFVKAQQTVESGAELLVIE